MAFAQSRLEFSEVDQKRYLAGLTVSRKYFFLSKEDVIADHAAVLDSRSVESFEGSFFALYWEPKYVLTMASYACHRHHGWRT